MANPIVEPLLNQTQETTSKLQKPVLSGRDQDQMPIPQTRQPEFTPQKYGLAGTDNDLTNSPA